MRTLVSLLLCLLLGACASQPPLPAHLPPVPVPSQWHVEREQAGQRQDWLLVLQGEGQGLRWSLLDPLGIPQARQVLQGQDWRADGLLPPNPAARELFAALLFALTPQAQLPTFYPQAESQADQRRLGDRWQVVYLSADRFTLHMADGLRYEISPLAGEDAP